MIRLRRHVRLPRSPHSWSITPRQAIALQRRLAALVVAGPLPSPVRYVAGLDAALTPDGVSILAAAVVWDAQEQIAVEQQTAVRRLRFPYVPGLLSFRETPVLLAAVRKLRRTPHVLMCDGHGFSHPRRFGIACHVGVVTGLPSIGCAKSILIGTHGPVAGERGAATDLLLDSETIGRVVRTQNGVRPVYVSVGHRIDLAQAQDLVLRCAGRFRLPEPTRLADRAVAAWKRAWRG